MFFFLLYLIFGLIVGSFINSFIWRYITKTTFKGRSICPSCKHKLVWYDNIPILSWVILSAKCRYCKKSISVQYPLVEMLTGLIFLLVGLFSAPANILNQAFLQITNGKLQITNNVLILNSLLLILLLIIASLLILISVYDYKTQEIPNSFNLAFITSAMLYTLISLLGNPNFILSTLYFLLSGLAAFLFFWVFVFFSKETWMGGGDAKLAFGMGLLLGPLNTFVAILLASWLGSIYGVVTLLVVKRKELKEKSKSRTLSAIHISHNFHGHQIPFGPFLALGTLISLLFGSQLTLWYAKIFLGM